MYSVLAAFPTAVYISNVNITEQELNFINEHAAGSEKLVYNNYMSTETYLLDAIELTSLKEQITKHLNVYIRDVVGYDIDLYLTQSWSNYNPKGSSHHTHKHRNSIVSGAIYLTEDPSPFVLMKPEDDMLVPDVSKSNQYNSPVEVIDVKKNNILLFPSHIRHGVSQNTSELTRVSVGFNSFYRGILGASNLPAMMKVELK
jgi:uncharacterized protein (TIGR02466 family)